MKHDAPTIVDRLEGSDRMPEVSSPEECNHRVAKSSDLKLLDGACQTRRLAYTHSDYAA